MGLKVEYGKDEYLKVWFKGCVSLVLLPSEKVGLAEELHASVKYEHAEKYTLRVRARKLENILRDLTISNAKSKYPEILN